MNQIPKNRTALGPIVALLGMGLLGTILFVLVLILLSPLILLMAIYLGIQRWKFRKVFSQARREATRQAVQQEDFTNRPTKHVEVTVHPIEETP
jgi:ABC-type bacteriocin/lantibiotic exporter with double-glycine peptidase domain